MSLRMSHILLFIFFPAMTIFWSSNNGSTRSQKGDEKPKVDRKPYAAGKFYTDNPADLKKELQEIFEVAKPKKYEDVFAIICPHAGYIYSGEVAASAFRQIDPGKHYKDIFIIGSSHRAVFDGASIYNLGDFITPLGTVPVDLDLANKLIRENPIFAKSPEYQNEEHCLEVELPFLQYWMKTEYKIIPIVVGAELQENIKKIASALKPYLLPENLFIISSDFSHYPRYADAVMVDKRTADAISTNNAEKLLKTLKDNDHMDISNLATSLCGQTSVLTMLYMTQDDPNVNITEIQYKNSGDASVGEKNRVVGYYSLAFNHKTKGAGKSSDFNLTEKDKKDLLQLSRKTLNDYIKNGKKPEIDAGAYSMNLKSTMGAFVTLRKQGNLRGCIGRFISDEGLYKVVEDLSIASATEDNRFPRVVPSEVDKIEIEISVLSPLKKIKSIDEIVMGKHGIYIKKGFNSGTFLPQVATETGWTKEEFLGHCSKDKAGMDWDSWKDAEIFIFEAVVFSESEMGLR